MTNNVMVRSGIRYGVEFPKNCYKQEILEWCRENYGEPGFKARWMHLDWTIQFRDKKDRDWYFLRWGA